MEPLLPHLDPDPQARAQTLEQARQQYAYAYDRFTGIAMAAQLHPEDQPTDEWMHLVRSKVLDVLANSAMVYLHFRSRHWLRNLLRDLKRLLFTDVVEIAHITVQKVQELEADAQALMAKNGMKAALEHMALKIRSADLSGHSRHMNEFAEMFQRVKRPAVARIWREDENFAWKRVAGSNPLMLRKILQPDPRLMLTEAQVESLLGKGVRLEKLAADGHLFLVDLTLFKDTPVGSYPNGPKYMPAPLALFAVHPRSKKLTPLAIRPTPDDPLWTPKDGMAWLMARTLYAVADGTWHQAVSHLAHTHLVMEPFILASRRQLAPNHPLRLLLNSHFQGTLYINDAADKMLCGPEGGVDAIMSPPVQASRQTAQEQVAAWDFNRSMLPIWLADRGLDDANALPTYPYRDDALLHWAAMTKWTRAYVDLYYPDDASVQADAELQAFAQEIVDPQGGRLRTFGEPNGQILTRHYLAQALAHVIFTVSVQHSAVNFPQYEVMSFTPNYPLSAYTPGPKTRREANKKALLKMLPPRDMALFQLELGFLLGSTRHTQLGDYPEFQDPRVAEPLAQFRQDLRQIEQTIDARNQDRPDYGFLKPSLVTHSVNI